MEGINCPNITECNLVTVKGFTGDEIQQQQYIKNYCEAGNEMWGICTRFMVKKALNFCPDFVLPDTSMTPDEVIDKFDKENQI